MCVCLYLCSSLFAMCIAISVTDFILQPVCVNFVVDVCSVGVGMFLLLAVGSDWVMFMVCTLCLSSTQRGDIFQDQFVLRVFLVSLKKDSKENKTEWMKNIIFLSAALRFVWS